MFLLDMDSTGTDDSTSGDVMENTSVDMTQGSPHESSAEAGSEVTMPAGESGSDADTPTE